MSESASERRARILAEQEAGEQASCVKADRLAAAKAAERASRRPLMHYEPLDERIEQPGAIRGTGWRAGATR